MHVKQNFLVRHLKNVRSVSSKSKGKPLLATGTSIARSKTVYNRFINQYLPPASPHNLFPPDSRFSLAQQNPNFSRWADLRRTFTSRLVCIEKIRIHTCLFIESFTYSCRVFASPCLSFPSSLTLSPFLSLS